MADKIIIRHGLTADLPALDVAELGFSVDSNTVNIGTSSGNIAVTSQILSVNGETGTVVLNTDDIAEGSVNLYYTEALFVSRCYSQQREHPYS